MLIVLLLIGISMIVVGAICCVNTGWVGDLGLGSCIVGTIFVVAVILTGVFLAIDVSTTPSLKQEIAMYESENAAIEKQVEETVKSYQKYERDIFSEVSSDNVMAVVTLYPELKSNTLVERQIYVYAKNNEKIKELKARLLYQNTKAWWLYFGKVA